MLNKINIIKLILSTFIILTITTLIYKYIDMNNKLNQLALAQKQFNKKVKSINSNINMIIQNRKIQYNKNFDIINNIEKNILKDYNDKTNIEKDSNETDNNISDNVIIDI